ncbi:MAG: C25 family peptidase propeptide domain-containing protein, partial [bacterium]|nr:C25 family peptidase propeptide domain-containing protein [bacterium]
MKKIFVFIMILLSFRASHQESIIINDSAEEFSVERVSGLYKIKTNRITYTQKNDYVFFNSFNFTNEIGLPKLPAVRIPVYSYSPDVKVTALSFKGKTNISLENPVFPVQRPRQKQSEKQIFDIEEKFYFSSQEYPSNVSSVVYAGYERGLYVSVIEIFPVRYNPGNNTITIYDEIDIEVSGNILFGSLDWDSAPSKYLIVTKDEFLPYISDFADFKTRQGFFVEVLNTDTIGVLNSDIKEKIQSLYDTSFIPL